MLVGDEHAQQSQVGDNAAHKQEYEDESNATQSGARHGRALALGHRATQPLDALCKSCIRCHKRDHLSSDRVKSTDTGLIRRVHYFFFLSLDFFVIRLQYARLFDISEFHEL